MDARAAEARGATPPPASSTAGRDDRAVRLTAEKVVTGRMHHTLVDTLALLVGPIGPAANGQDCYGAPRLLRETHHGLRVAAVALGGNMHGRLSPTRV